MTPKNNRLTVSARCPLCNRTFAMTGDTEAEARQDLATQAALHLNDVHADTALNVVAFEDVTVTASGPVSHFVPYDSPGRRRRQAYCGLTVDARDHADDPTCPDCRRILQERETSVGP